MPDAHHSPVVVVGGGWAGIAAAVTLARHGVPVTLMEAARHLGGRARSVPFDGLNVDNGQHLMIGAYRHMRGLLRTMDIDENNLFLRKPLRLLLRSVHNKSDLDFKAPLLPAPLHVAAALVSAKGLSFPDKWRSMQFCAKLLMQGFTIDTDTTVTDLLRRHKQTASTIRRLWTPLCIGALNTRPEMASAQLFLHVLKQSFTGKRSFSDLLIPRINLDRVLPEPAIEFLSRHGATIRLQQRVDRIASSGGQLTGITIGDETIATRQVILALPPYRVIGLIAHTPQLAPLSSALQQFNYDSICTVYLQYPTTVSLGIEMMGVYDGISQWIFDRKVCNQPGLMAVVISATSHYEEMDNSQLAAAVRQELATLFPHWPAPEQEMVIHEKRATFTSSSHINQHRPGHETALSGCWLAGDYTDTGLPATLEGAVQSGVQCAHRVIEHINRSGQAQ